MDTYHQNDKGDIKVFLSPVYRPVDHDDQQVFNEELDSFMQKYRLNTELLSGQYINSNVGTRSEM